MDSFLAAHPERPRVAVVDDRLPKEHWAADAAPAVAALLEELRANGEGEIVDGHFEIFSVKVRGRPSAAGNSEGRWQGAL